VSLPPSPPARTIASAGTIAPTRTIPPASTIPPARGNASASASADGSAAPSPIVRRAELDDIAWQVLLRDGDLVLLHRDVALPRGVAPTAGSRAAALADRVPRRAALARLAAVWVHLGGPPPVRVDVLWSDRLRPRDVERIGGVRVTALHRTALDVLAHEPPEVARPQLHRLVAAGVSPERLRVELAAAAGRRGVRGATRLLAELRGLSPRPAAPPPSPR
jgi:hypothetical protein